MGRIYDEWKKKYGNLGGNYRVGQLTEELERKEREEKKVKQKKQREAAAKRKKEQKKKDDNGWLDALKKVGKAVLDHATIADEVIDLGKKAVKWGEKALDIDEKDKAIIKGVTKAVTDIALGQVSKHDESGVGGMLRGAIKKDVKKPSISEEFGRALRRGTADVVESTGKALEYLGADKVGKSLERAGQSIGKGFESTYNKKFSAKSLTDPRFYANRVGEALPFLASMIPAGIAGGVAGATAATALRLGNLGRTLLAGLGSTLTTAPMESAMEAGEVYDELLKQGYDEKTARKKADEVFKKNLGLVGGSNFVESALAFGTGRLRPLTKIGKVALGATSAGVGAGIEALQEGGQMKIQADALEKEFSWTSPETTEAMFIGAILGGSSNVAEQWSDPVYRLEKKTVEKLDDEHRTRYENAKIKAKQYGLTDENAARFALDDLASTTKGQEAIIQSSREVVEELKQERKLKQMPRPQESITDIRQRQSIENQQGLSTGSLRKNLTDTAENMLIDSTENQVNLFDIESDSKDAIMNRVSKTPETPNQNVFEKGDTNTLPSVKSFARVKYQAGEKEFNVEFEHELDKAVYEATATGNVEEIKRQTGWNDEQIKEYGQAIRNVIKQQAKKPDAPATIVVPDMAAVRPVLQTPVQEEVPTATETPIPQTPVDVLENEAAVNDLLQAQQQLFQERLSRTPVDQILEGAQARIPLNPVNVSGNVNASNTVETEIQDAQTTAIQALGRMIMAYESMADRMSVERRIKEIERILQYAERHGLEVPQALLEEYAALTSSAEMIEQGVMEDIPSAAQQNEEIETNETSEEEPTFQIGEKVYYVSEEGGMIEAVIEDVQDGRYVLVNQNKKKDKLFVPLSRASEALFKDQEEAEKVAEQRWQQKRQEWHDWITGGMTQLREREQKERQEAPSAKEQPKDAVQQFAETYSGSLDKRGQVMNEFRKMFKNHNDIRKSLGMSVSEFTDHLIEQTKAYREKKLKEDREQKANERYERHKELAKQYKVGEKVLYKFKDGHYKEGIIKSIKDDPVFKEVKFVIEDTTDPSRKRDEKMVEVFGEENYGEQIPVDQVEKYDAEKSLRKYYERFPEGSVIRFKDKQGNVKHGKVLANFPLSQTLNVLVTNENGVDTVSMEIPYSQVVTEETPKAETEEKAKEASKAQKEEWQVGDTAYIGTTNPKKVKIVELNKYSAKVEDENGKVLTTSIRALLREPKKVGIRKAELDKPITTVDEALSELRKYQFEANKTALRKAIQHLFTLDIIPDELKDNATIREVIDLIHSVKSYDAARAWTIYLRDLVKNNGNDPLQVGSTVELVEESKSKSVTNRSGNKKDLYVVESIEGLQNIVLKNREGNTETVSRIDIDKIVADKPIIQTEQTDQKGYSVTKKTVGKANVYTVVDAEGNEKFRISTAKNKDAKNIAENVAKRYNQVGKYVELLRTVKAPINSSVESAKLVESATKNEFKIVGVKVIDDVPHYILEEVETGNASLFKAMFEDDMLYDISKEKQSSKKDEGTSQQEKVSLPVKQFVEQTGIDVKLVDDKHPSGAITYTGHPADVIKLYDEAVKAGYEAEHFKGKNGDEFVEIKPKQEETAEEQLTPSNNNNEKDDLKARDEYALKHNNRKLGLKKASILNDPYWETNPLLVIANLEKGDKFPINDKWYTVETITDKVLVLKDDEGKIHRYPAFSDKMEQLKRDVEGMLIGRAHGMGIGDLEKAIQREPAFTYGNGSLLTQPVPSIFKNVYEPKKQEQPTNKDKGEVIIREDKKRIDIKFFGKPSEATREELKKNKFRWYPKEQVWIHFNSEANRAKAYEILKNAELEEEAKTEQKTAEQAKVKEQQQTPSKPRKDAYESQEWRKEFTDDKGTWIMKNLWIDQRKDGKNYRYTLSVELDSDKPNVNNRLHVYVYADETEKDFAKTLKYATGYTPRPHTLKQMYEHFQAMKRAREEEDAYYAQMSEADKKEARKTLEEIAKKIVERYEKNEVVDDSRFRRDDWIRFSTAEERAQATEAQKVLNGYSYVEPDYSQSGHLWQWRKEMLEPKFREIDQKRKQQEAKEKKDRLQNLLDTKPEVRKMVAYMIKAAQEKETWEDAEIRMIHGLYGYTKNAEQFKKAYQKYREEFLKKYDLDYFDPDKLVRLAKENDEILPVVQFNHTREEGEWYYGDKVIIDGKVKMVKRVGNKYLHTTERDDSFNTKIEIEKAKRYEKADQIPEADAKTPIDHVYNALVKLNNLEIYAGAHELGFVELIRQIHKKGNAGWYQDQFRKAMLHAKTEEERKAFEVLYNEFRKQEIENSSYLLERNKQELEELKAKLAPYYQAIGMSKEDYYEQLDGEQRFAAEVREQHKREVQQAIEAGHEPVKSALEGYGYQDINRFPIELTKGIKTKAYTEDGEVIHLSYAIVEAKDLITSHDTNLNVNEEYPQELQPRDRSRQQSREQVQRIAVKLNPELLGESKKISDGSPIIGKDLIVESGNGRTIAIKKAYEENLPSIEAYQAWLREHAADFGFSESDVNKFNQPVLVRVRESDVDRKDFVRKANESSVQSMSDMEQALADAQKLDDSILNLLVPSEDGNLNTMANIPFINQFIEKVIGKNERNAYVDQDGLLSKRGVDRMTYAVFAKAYGDPSTVRFLTESTDTNIQNILRGLLVAAPKMAQLKQDIEEGRTWKELNITDDLKAALNKIAKLRQEGIPVKEFLEQRQNDIFAQAGEDVDHLSPLALEFMRIFDERKRSYKGIADLLNEYHFILYEVERDVTDATTGGGLFADGYTGPSKEEYMLAAYERTKKGGAPSGQETLDLFDERAERRGGTDTLESEKDGNAEEKRIKTATNGRTLEEVEEELNRIRNNRISGSGEMGISAFAKRKPVGKINPARKQNSLVADLAFDNPEHEKAFQEAQDIPKETPKEIIKRLAETLKIKLTREFEHLPNTAKFSPLRHRLLELIAQRSWSIDQATQYVRTLQIDLDQRAFELFRRIVILRDLRQEALQGRPVPFFMPDDPNMSLTLRIEEALKTIEKELAKYEAMLAQEPEVQKALDMRKKLWDALKAEYIQHMDRIGVNVRAKLTKEDYFRHIVIEKAKERFNGLQGGKKVRSPRYSKILKQRHGSELAIVTDYIHAEIEAMSQMLYDIQIADTIALVDREYNIIDSLKRQANEHNANMFDAIVQAEREGKPLDDERQAVIDKYRIMLGLPPMDSRQMEAGKNFDGTEQESAIEYILKRYDQLLAMSYAKLEQMANMNALWTGEAGEWKHVVESLKTKSTDKVPVNELFRYLSELAANVEEAGNIEAKTILKYTSSKREFLKEVVGKDYKTWEDFVPEGYTVWHPDSNKNIFYTALAIPEQNAMSVLEKIVTLMQQEGANFSEALEKHGKSLVLAGKREGMVIPEEVANTLEKVTPDESNRSTYRLLKRSMQKIKAWLLLRPNNIIPYNLRNLTGDIDRTFANPKAFQYVPRAAQELREVIYKHRAPSKEMQDWLKRGGIHSLLQTQDFGEIKNDRMFKAKIVREYMTTLQKITGLPKQTVMTLIYESRRGTNYFGAIFRYAHYLAYLDQLKKNGGKPDNYGASIREEIDALKTNEEKAFHLANDLMIPYNKTSALGQEFAETVFPFWRFMEGNFKTYIRMYRNMVMDEGLTKEVGLKLLGSIALRSPLIAIRAGKFAITVAALAVLTDIWNYLFFGDEEDELPEEVKRSVHIIYGRDKDGNVLYFDRLGLMDDVLEWFGLNDMKNDLSDFLNNRRTAGEILQENVLAPINKIVQAFNPLIKGGVELLTGKKFYPDFNKPSNIYEKDEHAFSVIGLGKEYKELKAMFTDEPTANYDFKSWLAIKTADVKEDAYYYILEEVRRFKERKGENAATVGATTSAKSEALYGFKLGLKYGDMEYAKKKLQEYAALGGKPDDVLNSLKRMHPLGALDKKEKVEFLKSLDDEQYEKYKKAVEYYHETILGQKYRQ